MHVDSRLHCSENRHLLWLGGQYGEESQIEDQVGGEENREEDQAENRAEEEVAFAPSTPRRAARQAWGRIRRRGSATSGEMLLLSDQPTKSTTEGVGDVEGSRFTECGRASADRLACCSHQALCGFP